MGGECAAGNRGGVAVRRVDGKQADTDVAGNGFPAAALVSAAAAAAVLGAARVRAVVVVVLGLAGLVAASERVEVAGGGGCAVRGVGGALLGLL